MKLTDVQITRILYSSWDFQQALSALTFLLEDCDFQKRYSSIELRRFRCYETTVIISMARPFEVSRNGTTLNLGALRLRLTGDERNLLDRVMSLRRKVIAHSDEEEMYFLSRSSPVLEGKLAFPELRFSEALHFEEAEYLALEDLLRKLKDAVATFVFDMTQNDPSRLTMTRFPKRLRKSDGESA